MENTCLVRDRVAFSDRFLRLIMAVRGPWHVCHHCLRPIRFLWWGRPLVITCVVMGHFWLRTPACIWHNMYHYITTYYYHYFPCHLPFYHHPTAPTMWLRHGRGLSWGWLDGGLDWTHHVASSSRQHGTPCGCLHTTVGHRMFRFV